MDFSRPDCPHWELLDRHQKQHQIAQHWGLTGLLDRVRQSRHPLNRAEAEQVLMQSMLNHRLDLADIPVAVKAWNQFLDE